MPLISQAQLAVERVRGNTFARRGLRTAAIEYRVEHHEVGSESELHVSLRLMIGAPSVFLDIRGSAGPLHWVTCAGATSIAERRGWLRIDFGAAKPDEALVTYRLRVDRSRTGEWLSLPDGLAQPAAAVARHRTIAGLPLPLLKIAGDAVSGGVTVGTASEGRGRLRVQGILPATSESGQPVELDRTISITPNLVMGNNALPPHARASSICTINECIRLLPLGLQARFLVCTPEEARRLRVLPGDSGVLVPVEPESQVGARRQVGPISWRLAAEVLRGVLARVFAPVGPGAKAVEEGLALALAWSLLLDVGDTAGARSLESGLRRASRAPAYSGWWHKAMGYPSRVDSTQLALGYMPLLASIDSRTAAIGRLSGLVGHYTDVRLLLPDSLGL